VYSDAITYDWDRLAWKDTKKKSVAPGLVIYARHDGSFAIWDPARATVAEKEGNLPVGGRVLLNRDQAWDGLSVSGGASRDKWVCNGLLRDWISWQTSHGRHAKQYESFVTCLEILSPSSSEMLRAGDPVRLPMDSREMPTLAMPYQDVPLIYSSAGIRRIISIAYVLVWAWFEHVALSDLIRRNPERRIIFLIDEVEAHLHPRWQRVIVPALLKVVGKLASSAGPQLHIATHSPDLFHPIWHKPRPKLSNSFLAFERQ
jgi:hypothetical protein